MEWSDEAIVLGVRRHGETGVLLELLTRDHGRHFGFLPGGRSRKTLPLIQPGNSLAVTWRARLDQHLGTLSVEATRLRAPGLIDAPHALYGFAALAASLRYLPERDPHPALYDAVIHLAEALPDAEAAGPLFVEFELMLLAELGFGLDLDSCAATGTREDLTYVSPRTGRAVSAQAGAPYREKLLTLPGFLVYDGPANRVAPQALAEAFALTGYFLQRWIYEPHDRAPPPERARFVESLTREDDPA